MKSRKFLIAVIILSLTGTIFNLKTLAAEPAFFSDTSGHWAQFYIEQLHNSCNVLGYLDSNGNPLHLYKPNNSISRAELVQLLMQCHKLQPTQLTADPFIDVKVGQWYAAAISVAKEKGWISGYSDGSFMPINNVKRVEALKIILLSKFSDNQISGGNATFPDLDKNAWYMKYVNFSVLKNYVSGYSNGLFGPSNNLTRAEAAKIISKIMDWPQPPVPTSPIIGACTIFPSDNAWNRDVSQDPIDPNSNNYISFIQAHGGQKVHPDFGSNLSYGIPYVIVPGSQAKVPINITAYSSESDPGPYPIPLNAPIEAGGDGHILSVDKDNCILYELYGATRTGSGFNALSAAKFDLKSNALRPEGWTSADAAGLPIYPGLVKYDEVAAGAINHALRFTLNTTQKAHIHPATHDAGSTTDPNAPPMGLRLRLKASFDLSPYHGESLVILQALKKYGMILADNGSNWYISGSRDARWNDDDLNQLKSIPGTAFEVVKSGTIIK